MFGSGCRTSDLALRPSDLAPRNTTLIISNEDMNGIMKIIKSLEESGSLTKGVSQINKNGEKVQKGEFLGILIGTLGASSLGNLLAREDTIRPGKDTVTSDQDL